MWPELRCSIAGCGVGAPFATGRRSVFGAVAGLASMHFTVATV